MSERLYKYYLTFICTKLGATQYFDFIVTLKHKLTEKSIDDIKNKAMSKYNFEGMVIFNAILLEE